MSLPVMEKIMCNGQSVNQNPLGMVHGARLSNGLSKCMSSLSVVCVFVYKKQGDRNKRVKVTQNFSCVSVPKHFAELGSYPTCNIGGYFLHLFYSRFLCVCFVCFFLFFFL